MDLGITASGDFRETDQTRRVELRVELRIRGFQLRACGAGCLLLEYKLIPISDTTDAVV